MKFAWRLVTVDNLWTKFFHAKYVKHSHIFFAETRRNASRFWKSIMNVLPDMAKKCDCKGHSQITIKDVWVDCSWDENYLVELVGLDKTEEIMNGVVAGKVGTDITIWKPDIKGDFTLASAWDLICALDSRVQSLGIPLASRCNCCTHGDTESLNHVLCNGSIAAERLWMHRCKVHMENSAESVDNVWFLVKVWIRKISSLMVKQWPISARDEVILRALEVPYVDRARVISKLVYWRKPAEGWIKLNVDGCCWGNPGSCGGGGVIRDVRGIFKGAFSSSFGHGTNNEAELRALLAGNSAADFLARWGEEGNNNTFLDFNSLPRNLKRILRLDKAGLPQFRWYPACYHGFPPPQVRPFNKFGGSHLDR
ncbi:hypothetical protein Patl1_03683 [Pistacia atlantica]|uniref:Uncharacterized protein n=1 Tax=Pistacia atlantica TaxID=434234 RepID=A0ACC1BWF0_9ROSI|nr:hypothetical protein Patl1_03683 [Pistacia atlantica]